MDQEQDGSGTDTTGLLQQAHPRSTFIICAVGTDKRERQLRQTKTDDVFEVSPRVCAASRANKG